MKIMVLFVSLHYNVSTKAYSGDICHITFLSKRPTRFHTRAVTLSERYTHCWEKMRDSITWSPPKPNTESQSFLPPTPTFACTWRTHWCILCKTFCHWTSFYWLRLWGHWGRTPGERLRSPLLTSHPRVSYHYKTGHQRSEKWEKFQVVFYNQFDLPYLDLPREAHFWVEAGGHGTRHGLVQIHHIFWWATG